MVRTISATEARVHFGEVMRRVIEQDETVVVEKAKKQGMVLLSMAAFEKLSARHEPASKNAYLERAREVRTLISRETQGRTLPSVDELIRLSREERDDELTHLALPAGILKRLKLTAGDRLNCIIREDGHLEFVPIYQSMKRLKGMVPPPTKPLTLQEMQDAIEVGGDD